MTDIYLGGVFLLCIAAMSLVIRIGVRIADRIVFAGMEKDGEQSGTVKAPEDGSPVTGCWNGLPYVWEDEAADRPGTAAAAAGNYRYIPQREKTCYNQKKKFGKAGKRNGRNAGHHGIEYSTGR